MNSGAATLPARRTTTRIFRPCLRSITASSVFIAVAPGARVPARGAAPFRNALGVAMAASSVALMTTVDNQACDAQP